jgi:hypothetical protein
MSPNLRRLSSPSFVANEIRTKSGGAGRQQQGLTSPGDHAAEAVLLNQVALEGLQRLPSP